MITLFGTYVPDNMRTLVFSLSVLLLAACSTTNLPISPHKIDVQQGNVIDQETVDKLKPGLTRSQVRFLLGTPLVVDPFRDNRWDYVYNYRTAGKLTAHSRLTLYFDRDVLSRIEVDGLQPPSAKADLPAGATPATQETPAAISVPEPQPQVALTVAEIPAKPAAAAGAAAETAAVQPAPQLAQARVEPPSSAAVPPVAAATPAAAPPPPAQPAAEAQAAPKAAAVESVTAPQAPAAETVAAPKAAATTASASRTRTSVVPPLVPLPAKPAAVPAGNAPAQAPQSVALQSETDPTAIKPDTMPAFPETAAPPDADSPVLAAVQAWAKAWSARDEQAYLAAYSPDFKPAGGFTRAEWEKRRSMLLSLSKNIEVRVESPVVEFPAEGRALVTFNQNYRSDSYHDAVIKQLLMGLQDGRWLILEERVMPAPKARQP